MANLPPYLNPSIGYAMWLLAHPELGEPTVDRVTEWTYRKGGILHPGQAEQAIAQARRNVRATELLHQRTEAASLRSACGYRCPPDTLIGLRVRFDYHIPGSGITRIGSVVVNMRADSTIAAALAFARRTFESSTPPTNSRMGQTATIVGDLTTDNIDAVSLTSFEGGHRG